MPTYDGDFVQDFQEMQAWIAMGGAAAPVTVEPVRIMPLTNSRPPALSDSESKVSASDKELPTLQWVLFKGVVGV